MSEMLEFVDAWKKESDLRQSIKPEKICKFGIKAIDDAVIGILQNDLIVIGADSGIGKSQLALEIAMHNASNDKKVALYFIEGGAEEAIARMKWQKMLDIYYKNYHNGSDIDYRRWRMNMAEDPKLMAELEEKALEQLAYKLDGNLHLYSFDKSFTINHLTNSLGYFMTKESFLKKPDQSMHNLDLIIIDHLQYFNLTNPKDELKEQTQILMKVKDITNFDKIPVILVSHLRKKDKERGLPSQEDFYGTSNIAKIASMAITIGNKQKENFSDDLYPTFFRFVKTRVKISSQLAILCNFNNRLQKYEDNYTIHRLKGDMPENEPVQPAFLPRWANKRTSYGTAHGRKPDISARVLGERREEDPVLPAAVQHTQQPGGDHNSGEAKAPLTPDEINWEE